jgi:glyoxylase-like metal-dependent hydrolase (beta-lactamase superfamily II)
MKWNLWAAALLTLVSATAYMAKSDQPVKTAEIEKRGLSAKDFPRIKKLANNVYSYEQLHVAWKNVTSNSGIIVTSAGVVVVDGQGSPDLVKKMVEDIKKLTPQPIKYVIVGSEHGDHTGGNSAFPAGVTFIASPKSKATLEAQSKATNRPANAPPIVVPQETVNGDKKVLKLGKTEIDVLFLGRAHTGGDLVVYLPKEKVLFSSETWFNRMFPSMAGGYPTEWLQVIKKEEQMNAKWYIPGHGFVDDPKVMKAELVEYQKSLEAVIKESKRLHDTKVSAEDAGKQANFGTYNAWTREKDNAPGAIKRVYDEADGKLK